MPMQPYSTPSMIRPKAVVLPLFCAISLTALSSSLHAEQWVKPRSTAPYFVNVGDTIHIQPEYSVTDPQFGEETGLGLRLHFSSQALAFQQLSDLFEIDSIGDSPSPLDDNQNHDNDEKTDQMLVSTWLNINAKWPGEDNLPAFLYKASFTVEDKLTDATTINFTASSNDARTTFQTEPFVICRKPSVSITADKTTVSEGNNILLTFSLTPTLPAMCGDINVQYTLAGEAENGLDFKALNGELRFPAGEAEQQINVETLKDDEEENAETLSIGLQAQNHYELAADQVVRLSIENAATSVTTAPVTTTSVDPEDEALEENTNESDVNTTENNLVETLPDLSNTNAENPAANNEEESTTTNENNNEAPTTDPQSADPTGATDSVTEPAQNNGEGDVSIETGDNNSNDGDQVTTSVDADNTANTENVDVIVDEQIVDESNKTDDNDNVALAVDEQAADDSNQSDDNDNANPVVEKETVDKPIVDDNKPSDEQETVEVIVDGEKPNSEPSEPSEETHSGENHSSDAETTIADKEPLEAISDSEEKTPLPADYSQTTDDQNLNVADDEQIAQTGKAPEETNDYSTQTVHDTSSDTQSTSDYDNNVQESYPNTTEIQYTATSEQTNYVINDSTDDTSTVVNVPIGSPWMLILLSSLLVWVGRFAKRD